MDSSQYDVAGEQGATAVAPDTLKVLQSTLQEAVEMEQLTEKMEEDLKAAKAQLNSIKANRIPDLMAELGMENMMWHGWEIKVADFVSGSLPAEPEKRKRAIAWLEANDAGGLIKTEVKIPFGKGQYDEAKKVAMAFEADGYAPSLDIGVHSSTLQAFARERLKSGETLDIETLGLFTGRIAKFSQVKSAK